MAGKKNIGTASVALVANATGFKKGVDEADKHLGRLRDSSKRTARSLKEDTIGLKPLDVGMQFEKAILETTEGQKFLKELIEGKQIEIETIKTGKFGRIVAEIKYDGYIVNDVLVLKKHARYRDY